MQRILKPIFAQQGGLNADKTVGDSQDIVKFKILINAWSCRMDIEDCTDKARSLFKEWQAAENPDNNPLVLIHIIFFIK